MSGYYDKSGSSNPNWKGGISYLVDADDILNLGEYPKRMLREKIYANVILDELTDCWLWMGVIFNSNGRACLSLRKRHLASRISFALFKGEIGDKKVLHTCDNVICVNPEHLWLGTNEDNSKDMVVKGRSLTCEKNPAAILTEDQVREIRLNRWRGSRKHYARKFGVSTGCIDGVLYGDSWSTLK